MDAINSKILFTESPIIKHIAISVNISHKDQRNWESLRGEMFLLIGKGRSLPYGPLEAQALLLLLLAARATKIV